MSLAGPPSFYLYGEPRKAVELGFVHVEELVERSLPNGWTIRPHAHAELDQLFLIGAGGGAMLVEDRVTQFEAPVLLVVPAGVVHGFTWSSVSQGAVLTIARTYFDELATRHQELAPLFTHVGVAPVDPHALDVATAVAATLRLELGWSADGRRAAIEGATTTLLVFALRALPSDASRPVRRTHQAALVARFRERIERRFRLRESIAVYADALGASETTLRAACAAVVSQPPGAIMDDRVMLEGRRALIYSDASVAEIAFALGFDDPAYFSRFFAKRAGEPPMRYRRRTSRG